MKRRLNSRILVGVGLSLVVLIASGRTLGASADDDCLQAAIELEERVLGDSVPEDPDELRQRNEDFESAFAELCPEAPPQEVVLDPSESESFVPEEGIFSPAEDILSMYSFTNYWVGQVDGAYFQVSAGSMDESPNQGGVVVVPYGAGPGGFIPSPTASGSLSIVSAAGEVLDLESPDGTVFVFDVASQTFVLSSPTPTSEPTP
jgi:hypothetical protein